MPLSNCKVNKNPWHQQTKSQFSQKNNSHNGIRHNGIFDIRYENRFGLDYGYISVINRTCLSDEIWLGKKKAYAKDTDLSLFPRCIIPLRNRLRQGYPLPLAFDGQAHEDISLSFQYHNDPLVLIRSLYSLLCQVR